MFGVKFREKIHAGTRKAWWFIGSGGAGTRLRVHALRFKTEADATKEIEQDAVWNPQFEFKVVNLETSSV